MQEISIYDLLKMNVKIIDVREVYEYSEFSLDKSNNIPFAELIENHNQYLVPNQKYYILCEHGRRSKIVCMELAKYKYDVVNVKEGICVLR